MKHLILSIAMLILGSACEAATYYVRPNGGTSAQCTGTANAAYPGSGEGRDCAWAHPFWALDEGGRWRIAGGDTLLLEPGSYAMGWGAPNTSGWCTREGAFDCRLPPLPSGPSPQSPTRVLGASWNSGCPAAPELWGTQRASIVLSMDGSSNVQIECLEITDHSGCVEFHADSSVRCQRDQYPYGEWAGIGIHAQDSKNVILRRLNIHGLAVNGIQAGRLTDWTVEDVRIAANGAAGWDGDLGGVDSSNSGTLTFRRWKVEWNGCAETWPGKQPNLCWAQEAGGYGDGVGTAASTGHWIIEDSEFSHNTSDGLDLLYLEPVRGVRPKVEIRRTTAAGNAGNQIKVSGDSTIVNTVAVGNCMFFLNKPFGRYMGAANSGDHCRAFGATIALFMHRGDAAFVLNTTIVGQGDGMFTIECRGPGGSAPDCNGTEAITIQNNIFAGYGDYIGGDEAAFAWDPNNLTRERVDYNVFYNLREAPCPAVNRNVCANPLFADPVMETFNGRLRAGSPAIDSGLAAGALGGRVPAEDYTGAARPSGSGVDRGAYEFGAAAALPVVAALTSSASGQSNSLAPGSLMTLYGRGLANSTASAQALPLPVSLGGVQVLFGDVAAGLVYVSDVQVNLLAPDLPPGSSTTLTVVRGSARSAPSQLAVVAVAPAVFEIPLGSETRGAVTDAMGGLITAANPAAPGAVLVAYATGLGASDPAAGLPGLRESRIRPVVVVGGRQAVIQFAGPNPNFPGLDQVNFVVPQETARGGEVELWIEQSGRKSKSVFLPVR
ncbi:MAG: right-handed parallel beta-helix repeat-containing protein [Bryobacterales bacterium]|nr:right-handed parallel beta-helix repeat-containing protein [Bryobacterales bacterium]